MKILLINTVFDKGSTGKIVSTLHNNLMRTKHESYVIFGRGKKVNDTNVFKKTIEIESKLHHFFSKLTGNMYGGMFFSTSRIIKKIKRIKPDVVNLHCLNGYFVNIYKLLKWLALNNIKTVLTMHADFMMTGGCGYALECKQYLNSECKNCQSYKTFNGRFSFNYASSAFKKMKKVINLFKNENLKITCVSPWLKDRYSASPIFKERFIRTILNPVDDLFFKEKENNPYTSKNNILYVTPDITDYVKSGWLIDKIASRRPDLHFTIICMRDIDFNFKNKNITYIKGGVTKSKLRDYYYYANATIILSKKETFSMVVAESLACGTPVYGFKSGGPETIAIDEYCLFFDYGNIDDLAKNLVSLNDNKSKIINCAEKKYGSKIIINNYIDVFNSF